MDGIIEVKVNGYSISKDNSCAGTQYENKSTKLRITFSENWDGLGKKITFWNALGENPVDIQLGTSAAEDITKNYSVFLVPIPGEAMTEAGELEFVIEGVDTATGVIKRTAADTLKVKSSPKADCAGEPADPTPSQAEQLRAEIDGIADDIAETKKLASDVRGELEKLDESVTGAEEAAERAEDAREAVENITVTSETLDIGAEPTVEKSVEGDSVNLHFGIPASGSGVHMGTEAPTDPHMNVWIDTDESADDAATKQYVDNQIMYAYDAMDHYVNKNMVTDNLESEITGDVLSANMGRVLNEKIEAEKYGLWNDITLTEDVNKISVSSKSDGELLRGWRKMCVLLCGGITQGVATGLRGMLNGVSGGMYFLWTGNFTVNYSSDTTQYCAWYAEFERVSDNAYRSIADSKILNIESADANAAPVIKTLFNRQQPMDFEFIPLGFTLSLSSADTNFLAGTNIKVWGVM